MVSCPPLNNFCSKDECEALRLELDNLKSKVSFLEDQIVSLEENFRLLLDEYARAILNKIGDTDQRIEVLGASTEDTRHWTGQILDKIFNKPDNYDIYNEIIQVKNCCQDVSIKLDSPSLPPDNSALLEKIYKILGGDSWIGDSVPYIRVNPEKEVEEWQPEHYGIDNISSDNPQDLIVNNLLDFIQVHTLVNFFRLGGEHFPIKAPQSLTTLEENPELLTLDSIAEFNHYQLLALDELIGQFPIEIKIAKDHPINRRKLKIQLMSVDNKASSKDYTLNANEDTQIKVPNLAEGIAELIGQNIASHTHLITLQKVGFSMLAEIAILKKLAIEGDSQAKAILTYLGIDIKLESDKFPLTFNPQETSQDLDEHLTPTHLNYQKSIYKLNKNNPSLQRQLQSLLEAAAIQKGANFQTIDINNPTGAIKKLLKRVIEANESLDEQQQDGWEDFINDLEDGFITEAGISDNAHPYGVNFDQRPRIRELGNDQSGDQQ